MSLSGKIALVTGAASGIGRAGCLLFAERGLKVVAVDVDAAGLKSLEDESQGAVRTLTVDLSDSGAVRPMVAKAAGIFGGIDILWSNAGTNGPAELEDMDLDHYNKTISLNLTAGILAAQACVPLLREKGGGAILFTSSTSGLVGSPRYAIYTATKFALVGYTKTLAQRLAPENIRVNAICPGQTDTPMVRNLVKGAAKEHLAGMMAAIPMGRAAEALEIAKTAYWLASEESSFVTGIALPVDGGFTSR